MEADCFQGPLVNWTSATSPSGTAVCKAIWHLYGAHSPVCLVPLRHPCPPDQRPHSPTVDMEQDRVSVSQGLGTDSASYHCSACHGNEDWGPSHPFRGRAKSRSLSASPATASTKEFRYEDLCPHSSLTGRVLLRDCIGVCRCREEHGHQLVAPTGVAPVHFSPHPLAPMLPGGIRGVWVVPGGTSHRATDMGRTGHRGVRQVHLQ